MMDAQDRQELLFRVERLLVDLAPTLGRVSPGAYKEASAVFASIVTGELAEPGAVSAQLYADAAAMTRPATVRIPPEIDGKFPYIKPAVHLRDQQAQIEEMLAPLSERRRRAHHLARQLKPSAP